MPQQRPDIRSEAVQDILTKVPHWMILWGNTIVFVLLLLFFLLSWLIKYPDIISAQAIVTSLNPPEKQLANFSGRIDTLLVEDNQTVKSGDLLAVIENSADFQDVLYLKQLLDTLHLEKDHFNFPIENIPLLNLGDINSSFALFETEYINFKLNNTLQPYLNTLNANQLSVVQINHRIQNLDRQKQLDAKGLRFSEKELDRYKTLYDKGVISLQDYESNEIKHLNAVRSFNNLDLSISQLKQTLVDANRTKNETQINTEMGQIRLFKNAVQALHKLREAIKNWERNYVLKSHIDGQVSFMGVWNKHQNVTQGDLVFTVIPTNVNAYIAKIKAPIQNSGKIKEGQNVQISLANYPEEEYGMLQGNVQSMSAIPDTEGFYRVDVSLEKELTTSYNIKIPFKTEMSGTGNIITEDLRLLERFFYQLRGIFE